jgi:rsbT co-antagonist protein RsbR
LTSSTNSQEITYGLIEVNPNGFLLHVNNEGKRLLFSNESTSNYLFERISHKEAKTKLHECFMGKTTEFISCIDTQPYFFLFHRTLQENKIQTIHIYIFNIQHLLHSHENSNWNNHLLSSIGEMAAGIAHEVRNPLTAVKGFLQLMEKPLIRSIQRLRKAN